ncbi:squalene synthetase-like protein [Mucor velutinosus]|uniref:Squalene synthetase-like protein n=1 Tax=Mucor velutinosus TaxID=708070 RepID=A0AAN7HWZ3_9FUNG|nr:squalene synthetase-like protein [Mucor velutinosus]
MKDILSPTTQHAYLDFDFSEFIDNNFDMSNDILPNTKPLLSPSVVSSSSVASNTHLDDLFSDTASNSNYTLEHSPSSVYLNNPLWSSIEELAYNTSKKEQITSLSCIDTFINDPNSDLVKLVQQSQAEHDFFQHLIIESLINQPPQYDYYQQQRVNYEAQQRYYQGQHGVGLTRANTYTTPPPPPLSAPTLANLPKKRKQNPTTKRNSAKSSAASQYSSANNTQYTHSDQVNAQLLKELIRQAGRNAKHPMNSSLGFDMAAAASLNKSLNISPPLFAGPTVPSTSMDLQQYTSPRMNGNYPANHNTKTAYQSSSSNNSSRYSHHLPYKIQTNATSKKTKQQKTHLYHPYQRSSSFANSSSSSSNIIMGKPSMYSSDMSQAQLLEIQAISRAQQDFIRAREQQEAEKGLLMKHHHHHPHSKKPAQ